MTVVIIATVVIGIAVFAFMKREKDNSNMSAAGGQTQTAVFQDSADFMAAASMKEENVSKFY